ncbi:DUF7931 domain-containing protein [Massilia forsythiae]|nr:hypothetical protein [Massilia forsythiae]
MTDPGEPAGTAKMAGMEGIVHFDSRARFQQALRALLERAHATLDLFDPDFALFELGSSATDALLRRFLHGGSVLRLALHSTAHLERHAPRFLRLLRDYDHLSACRQTPRDLRQLADSFAIADNLHVVRRFHAAHPRGVLAFDAPGESDLPRTRFAAIWEASRSALPPTVTGL